MKLSIIVPVYNVEKYLRKCVISLVHQDFENYEVILVDDGSTDESPQICDEFVCESQESRVKSQEYPLIRVIHQANAGVGAARNAGLKQAKGEYLCFVDSDDYWEPNVLGTLMAQAEREQLDVLRFDYRNVRLKVESRESRVNRQDSFGVEYEVFEPNKYPHQVDTQTDIVSGLKYLEERMGYACYPVMFIIRRGTLINDLGNEGISELGKDCLFTEGIHFEDTEWLPRMMLRAKRVNSTPLMVYNYFLHEGSITQVQGQNMKMRQNMENMMFVIEQYSKYRIQYPQCRWLRNMQSIMTLGVLTSIARVFYEDRDEFISRLWSMDIFPLTMADQGTTYTRRAILVNLFGPKLYCTIMRLTGKW